VLARINRELGGNFDPRAFQHRAFYNEDAGRVEIYIESTCEQTVTITQLDMEVHFGAGEQIHTENSYKYDLSDITRLASETGFTRARTWLDKGQRFSSNLLLAV
jgi:L-histidine N-alpha-methyltransferase